MISMPYDNKLKSTTKVHSQDSIPSFIRKTYDILEERKNPDIIDWNPEGTALVIKKPSEFAQKVLPMYFKHNNLTSFVRQLNMYNFHKRRTQNVDHVYYHELFQRGKKHLLKEIRRKNHDTNNHQDKYPRSIDSAEHSQMGKEYSSIVCENQFLKKLYNDAMSKIALFEGQVAELTNQNASLRAQLYPNASPVQVGYKSVPATLENDVDFNIEPVMPTMSDLSIPPLKIGMSQGQLMKGAVTANPYLMTEESTEATDASHNSPSLAQQTESDKNYIITEPLPTEMDYNAAPLATLNLNLADETMKAPNSLKISRGDTSMGKLFESWNAQNLEINQSTVLGKRDLNVEKGISQFDFAEPALKKNELNLFAKRSLISNGIEDKELMRIFAQRGISNEDFGVDLMNFN